MLPNFLRGKVELIAEAYDTASIAVPGEWAGTPVAPALLTWRVQNLGGKVVVKEQVAVDFRQNPPARLFPVQADSQVRRYGHGHPGNQGSRSRRLSVHNRPGWVGS
jgi:hypothetical protein